MLKNETNQESKKKRNNQMKIVNDNYRKRMKEKGMFYFCMWIPKSILDKVKNYIEDMRKYD